MISVRFNFFAYKTIGPLYNYNVLIKVNIACVRENYFNVFFSRNFNCYSRHSIVSETLNRFYHNTLFEFVCGLEKYKIKVMLIYVKGKFVSYPINILIVSKHSVQTSVQFDFLKHCHRRISRFLYVSHTFTNRHCQFSTFNAMPTVSPCAGVRTNRTSFFPKRAS